MAGCSKYISLFDTVLVGKALLEYQDLLVV